MSTTRITTIEAIALILTIFIAHTIVSLPRELLATTKSAVILNLIFIGAISIFIVLLVVKLFKNFSSADIIDVSEYLGGPTFKKIIGFVFIFYFLFNTANLIRIFSESTKNLYFPMTNLAFILMVFITAICLVLHYKFSTIIKVNLLVLPVVLFSMIFIFSANFNKFSLDNVFPILGENFMSTFVYGLGNLGALGGISIIYFLPPYLQDPKKYKKASIIAFVVGIIYFILCVATVLFLLPFLTSINEVLPLYASARYIEFGAFFERLESIFLLIWTIAIACYSTISIYLALNTFKKITNIENYKPMIVPFGILVFTIALLPNYYSQTDFLETTVYKYLVICVQFILAISILVLANLKYKSTRKEMT